MWVDARLQRLQARLAKTAACFVLCRLRHGQARRGLFLCATALQMRKEQQRHDESENERVRMHRVNALHDPLLDEKGPAAAGEFDNSGGCARTQERRAAGISTRSLDALQRIADDEQQHPQFDAEQHLPRRKLEKIRRRRLAHHAHRAREEGYGRREGKHAGHRHSSTMRPRPTDKIVNEPGRAFPIMRRRIDHCLHRFVHAACARRSSPPSTAGARAGIEILALVPRGA